MSANRPSKKLRQIAKSWHGCGLLHLVPAGASNACGRASKVESHRTVGHSHQVPSIFLAAGASRLAGAGWVLASLLVWSRAPGSISNALGFVDNQRLRPEVAAMSSAKATWPECTVTDSKDASGGNQARVTSMATMYSTTRPLMLVTSRWCFPSELCDTQDFPLASSGQVTSKRAEGGGRRTLPFPCSGNTGISRDAACPLRDVFPSGPSLGSANACARALATQRQRLLRPN